MESIEKLRVLLKHWIDHNGGHVQEFDKWRDVMAGEHKSMATALSQAMEQMDAVSATLQAALDELGGPLESTEHHHHHHHHHDTHDDHDH